MTLTCALNDTICYHPKATLQYPESHIDDPGHFNATLLFESPTVENFYLYGAQAYHYDIYNALGELIDGNEGSGTTLLDLEIPAGLSSYSFSYFVPDPYITYPSDGTQYNGTRTTFFIEGNNVPQFTFDVREANAVPEPASWAMMIAGFGIVGYRVRRKSAVHPSAITA